MSWLARSIVDTLRLQEDLDNHQLLAQHGNPDAAANHSDRRSDTTVLFYSPDPDPEAHATDAQDPATDYTQGRGLKEDLSEFKDSFARQLWGVASFLAPLPSPQLGQRSDSLHLEFEPDRSASDTDDVENEKLVEDYGSRLPGQLEEQGDLSPSEDYYSNIVEDAVGITDEALAFAKNIAHHPETWLDFPLSEEEDFEDFDISDAQYKHGLAVEHLAPRLAALRIELCPVHMGVSYFWMVYFVLLHSRLNKHDADALSSPQLVKARAMWMKALQKQTQEELYGLGANTFHLKEGPNSPRENFMMYSYGDINLGNRSDQISPFESSRNKPTAEHEIEKHPVNDIEFVDKSVIREDPAPKLQDKEMITGSSSEILVAEDNVDDDDDDWLKEDSDLIGYSSRSVINEDDISFSDLEDDCAIPSNYKISSAEENVTAKS